MNIKEKETLIILIQWLKEERDIPPDSWVVYVFEQYLERIKLNKKRIDDKKNALEP